MKTRHALKEGGPFSRKCSAFVIIAETKILETVILQSVNDVENCDMYQFGFKKSHSTGLCTSAVKRTIDYYLKRGNYVFACFIDFRKAFDMVNY